MSPEDGTVESYWKGYDEVFPILESKGVPFTFVFGNHDDESAPTVTKEEMLKKYQSYEGCLAYDADPALHGCATHNLPILSSDGKKVAYNLWMFDSGDYVFYENGKRRGYDCVRADQIEWYKAESAKLKAANGGFINATDCADYLTKKGMPFRDAYKLTGCMVSDCIAKDKTLEELTLDEFKGYSALFENDIYDAIDLIKCCEGRTSYGGPSEASVNNQIRLAMDQLAAWEANNA